MLLFWFCCDSQLQHSMDNSDINWSIVISVFALAVTIAKAGLDQYVAALWRKRDNRADVIKRSLAKLEMFRTPGHPCYNVTWLSLQAHYAGVTVNLYGQDVPLGRVDILDNPHARATVEDCITHLTAMSDEIKKGLVDPTELGPIQAYVNWITAKTADGYFSKYSRDLKSLQVQLNNALGKTSTV